MDEILHAFNEKCKMNLISARRSGGVPDDLPEIVLERIILAITAEQMAPTLPKYKKVLDNLRYMI